MRHGTTEARILSLSQGKCNCPLSIRATYFNSRELCDSSSTKRRIIHLPSILPNALGFAWQAEIRHGYFSVVGLIVLQTLKCSNSCCRILYVLEEIHEASVCPNIHNQIQSVYQYSTFQYSQQLYTRLSRNRGILSATDDRQGAAAVADSNS